VQSPDGQIPVGGRSAQHIWNEPESAAIWERYATAYAKVGKDQEAGMFKRAAHLALREANRWIDDQGSPQIAKNWYPPQDRHGYMAYSYYATYGLLTASMLSSAWEAAEDGIAERAAPADLGGVLVQVPELKSVIAHAGGAYVNYLMAGDQHYDPTGLVRVHLKGSHPQLGPSCGIIETGAPADRHGKDSSTPWAIGPVWTAPDGTAIRLAAFTKPGMRIEKAQVSSDRASFVAVGELSGPGGTHRVEESITLAGNAVQVDERWTGSTAGTLAVSYPALATDGKVQTVITVEGRRAELRRPDAGGIAVEIAAPQDATIARTGRQIVAPNGMIDPLMLRGGGDRIQFTISTIR
jgi:hypothetical protein